MIEIHKEIVRGAPFPLRQQTADELEKLARHNPQEAACQRIASDFHSALNILGLHYNERYVVDSVGFTRISNEPPNARFWTFYHNSWVKLTLRFCQSLAFGFSAPDDEGYSFESNLYTYQRDDRFSDTAPLIVLNEWSNGGRDCDGSIRRSGAHFSPLDQLAATESYMEQGEDKSRSHFQGRRIRRPEWQEFKECRVHDQFAEAANY
jgi:hypothetical protein